MNTIGPNTLKDGKIMKIYDAGKEYKRSLVMAGQLYGINCKGWGAKGPYLLGVKCVIA